MTDKHIALQRPRPLPKGIVADHALGFSKMAAGWLKTHREQIEGWTHGSFQLNVTAAIDPDYTCRDDYTKIARLAQRKLEEFAPLLYQVQPTVTLIYQRDSVLLRASFTEIKEAY